MRPTTAMLRVVPLVLFAACATATPATMRSGAEVPRRTRPASTLRDPITEADIQRIRATSAYDAIVRLRANFLSNRGMTSFLRPMESSRPTVFVDGMELGTLFELRSIPANHVREIRFLSGAEAMTRYGDGHMAGVILVSIKR